MYSDRYFLDRAFHKKQSPGRCHKKHWSVCTFSCSMQDSTDFEFEVPRHHVCLTMAQFWASRRQVIAPKLHKACVAAWPNGSQRRFRYSQNCKVDGSSRRSQRWGGQRGHGFSLKFKLQIIIIKIKVLTFSALGVLIVLDFEQTTCVMCLCWWGRGACLYEFLYL